MVHIQYLCKINFKKILYFTFYIHLQADRSMLYKAYYNGLRYAIKFRQCLFPSFVSSFPLYFKVLYIFVYLICYQIEEESPLSRKY